MLKKNRTSRLLAQTYFPGVRTRANAPLVLIPMVFPRFLVLIVKGEMADVFGIPPGPNLWRLCKRDFYQFQTLLSLAFCNFLFLSSWDW